MFNRITRSSQLHRESGDSGIKDRGPFLWSAKLITLLIAVGLGIWLFGGTIAWAQTLRVYGPGTCDFGTAGPSETPFEIGCWIIANTGAGTLSIDSITFTLGTSTRFSITSPAATPFNLASGEARLLVVQFSPAGGSGLYTGGVTIWADGWTQNETMDLRGKVGTPVVRTLVVHSVNVCQCSSTYGWVGLTQDNHGNYNTMQADTFYYNDGTQVTLGVKVGYQLDEWHKNGVDLGSGSGEHREITVKMDSSFSIEAIWLRLAWVPTSTGLSCGWDPPAQPTGVVATAVSSSAIDLIWQYNPGNTKTDHFGILYSNNQPAGGVPASERSWTDSGLSPNTQYCYYVKACNSCSCGQHSTPVACARTLPGGGSTRTLTVNSSNSSGDPIGGVYITVTPPDKNGSSNGTTSFTRTYDDGTDVTLTAPSTYGGMPFVEWWQDGSFYNSSKTVTVTMNANHTMSAVYGTGPPPPQPPAAPSNLMATAYTSSWIGLKWKDNSDNEDGFKIYRKVQGGSYSYLDTVGANDEDYNDWGLNPETTYCYKVRAYNAAGNSSYSNEDCATTPPRPAPSPPSNLTAEAVSEDQIDLSWTDTLYEDGYKIYRKVQGSSYSYLTTVGADEESYSDTGLNPETTYCYKVKAYNAQGESDYSNEDCDTTLSPPELSVTPSTACDLGRIRGGLRSSAICWTVANTGGSILTVTVSVDPPFVVDSDESFWLEPSASRQVLIEFHPLYGTQGMFINEVTFDSNGGKATRIAVGKAVSLEEAVDEDFETGNFSKFPWGGFGGDQMWSISDTEAHSGEFSAQAGPLEYGQRASLIVTLDNLVASQVEFVFKVSSACTSTKDVRLQLFIDQDVIPMWVGNKQQWTYGYATILLTPGSHTHTFRWTLLNECSIEGATATAWLDDINFPFAVMPDTPQFSVDGPETCDFGEVQVGSSAEKDCWTVTNSLGGTLEGTVTVSDPFSVVSGGSFLLGTGESQTVRLRFSPTTVQGIAATVSFTSNGGNSDKTAQGISFAAGGPTVEDFETADLSKFPWTTAGDAEWFVTDLKQYQGSFSGKAGAISDTQYTDLWVDLTVESGNISFWFKVSSEQDWDFLIFYIDDTAVGWWSGEVDWAQFSYPVSAGQHTLGWMYWKDGSVSSGDDTAWIDDIQFPPISTPADTPAVFRVTREGNVYADKAYYGQNFLSGSADMAEWVPVSEPVGPGDVLELDPETPGHYRKSRGPCSTLVAGVVSTNPGFVLDSPTATDASRLLTPGRALLALIGIVPVKVTDEGGPIQPGDLLVTSSTPGHAMRWDPDDGSPCNLVGKALEPLTEESGIILALLTAH